MLENKEIEQIQEEINNKVELLLEIREFKEKYPKRYEAFLKLKEVITKSKIDEMTLPQKKLKAMKIIYQHLVRKKLKDKNNQANNSN
jgi:hypothetical protein